MSRQGGPGIGGGTAAGRHRAISLARSRNVNTNDSCTSCGKPVASMAVLHAGRLYCSWDCTGVVARATPGQFFG